LHDNLVVLLCSVAQTSLGRRVKTLRRQTAESLGVDRYSKLAYGGMDEIIQRYCPHENGFFVEAGASDGLSFSNTYYLERWRGWRGVLVEPVPDSYRVCVRNRPRSLVVNCALVASGRDDSTIRMRQDVRVPGHSNVEGIFAEMGSPEPNEGRVLSVSARTLTQVLDEAQAPQLDFLSLDVEGYELCALRGLDLERYPPGRLLVEIILRPDAIRREIEELLGEDYELVARPTDHDYLYARSDPGPAVDGRPRSTVTSPWPNDTPSASGSRSVAM
jgi:FkbM family methyltransferase